MPRLATLVNLLLSFNVLRLNGVESWIVPDLVRRLYRNRGGTRKGDLPCQKIAVYQNGMLSFVDSTQCGSEELCGNSINFSPEHHCQCDNACPVYGDCCRDSPLFRIEDTQSSNFVCIPVQQDSMDTYVFVKNSCPDDWQDELVRQSCQEPNREDPLGSQVPLTDISTMLTYRNAHCATCNNVDITSLKIWRAELRCFNVREKRPNGTNFSWEPEWKKWVISENGTKYPCKGIVPVVPPNLERVRNCPSVNIVKKCVGDWTNSTAQELCSGYTAYVTVRKNVYRNIYCAICNGMSVSEPSCEFPKAKIRYSGPPSLRLLLDFEFGVEGHLGITARACESTHELYDPFFKKCRKIFSMNAASNGVSKVSVQLDPEKQPEQCEEVVLNKGEFAFFDNHSVWVYTYSKRYDKGEFSFTDGRVAVCVPESNIMGTVTYIGLGTSVIFLTLHLCAVALVPDLRNLSGNTLASLCVALLFAYISFLTGGLLQKGDKTFCKIAAVTTYYFFLASFAWMLVLGFDVWRALIRAVHFQVCRGGQWRRFLFYSLFSWLIPGVMTTVTLALDTESSGEWFRPEFGLRWCWFSRTSSSAIFFGMPVLIIMCLNVGFFVSAARIAMGARPGDPRPGETGARRDFRLYVRLAVMFGLTWLVGLLANVWNKKAIWLAFIVLNTLQGLFIFLMFTCTGKVARGLIKNYSWAQSMGYSMSRESKKSTTTKSSSITRASNGTLTGPEPGPESNSDNGVQENSSFLQKAFMSRALASDMKRTSNCI